MTSDNLDRCLRAVDNLVIYCGEAMQNDRDELWGYLFNAFAAIEQALIAVKRRAEHEQKTD